MAGSSLIGALRVTLGMDSAQFERGAKKAKNEAQGLRGSFGKMGAVLAGAFVGFSVAGAIGQLRDMNRAALDAAGGLAEQAAQLGVNTTALQEYRYAATQVGLSQDDMDQALSQLTRRLGDAAAGAKGPAEAMAKLGISLRDSNGQMRDAGSTIPLIAQALQAIPSPAERAAVLVDLFGKSGQKLAPLLGEGAAGVAALTARARELGIVLSESEISKADETADKLAEMDLVLQAKLNKSLLQNAEAMTQVELAWGEFKIGMVNAMAGIINTSSWWAQFKLDFLRNTYELEVQAVAAMQRLYAGVKGWISDKLNAVWSGAMARIETVRKGFYNLYDAVVGHSYIPDMVDGIANHMGRLAAVMVAPATRATGAVSEAMRAMASDTQSLLDRLFPEVRKLLDYRADLATIAASGLSADLQAEARRRAGLEYAGVNGSAVFNPATTAGPIAEIPDNLDKMLDGINRTADGTEAATVRIAESFAQMTDRALGSIDGLVRAVKGGDFLGIVRGVLGALDSFGAAFTGGKGFKIGGAVFGNSGGLPRFANGGSFAFGGLGGVDTNLLSLNGSPIARVSRGEVATIRPANDPGGGQSTVRVELVDTTGLFQTRVQQISGDQLATAAPAIMNAGANMAMARQQKMAGRAL